MNKWLLVVLLVLLVFLIVCKPKEAEDKAEEAIASIAQQTATNLQTAEEKLAAGEVSEGVELLLDAVLLNRPSESWPDGFREKLESARGQFLGSNFKEGVSSITEALELFKASIDLDLLEEQEKQEQMPVGVAELIKNNLDSAMEKFKEGDADSGIILILEALTLFAPNN